MSDAYAELITGNTVVTFVIFVLTLFTAGQKAMKMIRKKEPQHDEEAIKERNKRRRHHEETYLNVKNLLHEWRITPESAS